MKLYNGEARALYRVYPRFFFLLEKTQHVYNPIRETCPKNGILDLRAQKGTKGHIASGALRGRSIRRGASV